MEVAIRDSSTHSREPEWCTMEVETSTLNQLNILEIVGSFFEDCLAHPGLLFHSKMKPLRNFIQRTERGILDPNAPNTNSVSFPLASYRIENIGKKTFSKTWCEIISNNLDSYGQIHLKWEPKKEFLTLIENFISCCNQEDVVENRGVLLWMNQFLKKFKLRTVTPVIFVDKERIPVEIESTSSNEDVSTEYSTSSINSGTDKFLLNGNVDFESDAETVYVTIKDLKAIEKSIRTLTKNCGSNEEKNNPTRERSRSSSPEIEQSNIDPLRALYQVKCCHHNFRSLKDLYKHLKHKHKLGLKKAGSMKCKLCGDDVSNQLQMLHIEFFHEYAVKGAYEVKKVEIDGESQAVIHSVKL